MRSELLYDIFTVASIETDELLELDRNAIQPNNRNVMHCIRC
jgi:hypothetical protein